MLTLNYAKLADIEQGEKETPGKFLDYKRLSADSKSTEKGMILKIDFLLSQLQVSAISYKNRCLDQISL